MTQTRNDSPNGIAAYCRLHNRYVRIVATDGEKNAAFVMDRQEFREQAYHFYAEGDSRADR